MSSDYLFLAIVALLGFGGGMILLHQARKYRRARSGPANTVRKMRSLRKELRQLKLIGARSPQSACRRRTRQHESLR